MRKGLLYKLNKEIELTEHTFRTSALPKGESGFRIAQVSDLQSSWFGKGQCELLNAVSKAEPDVIFVTGDILDRDINLEASKAAMLGLRRIAPVYYVNGNHECDIFDGYTDEFYKWMNDVGIKVLLNSVESTELAYRGMGKAHKVNIMGLSEEVIFNARGQIAGTGYKSDKKGFYPEILDAELYRLAEAAAMKAHGQSEYKVDVDEIRPLNILLAHEPQYLENYTKTGADLIFCGHAHGGQFRFPSGKGLYAPEQGLFPKYTFGSYEKNGSVMYVSRGLGNSSRFNLRLNNKPEIVVVTVLPK